MFNRDVYDFHVQREESLFCYVFCASFLFYLECYFLFVLYLFVFFDMLYEDDPVIIEEALVYDVMKYLSSIPLKDHFKVEISDSENFLLNLLDVAIPKSDLLPLSFLQQFYVDQLSKFVGFKLVFLSNKSLHINTITKSSSILDLKLEKKKSHDSSSFLSDLDNIASSSIDFKKGSDLKFLNRKKKKNGVLII